MGRRSWTVRSALVDLGLRGTSATGLMDEVRRLDPSIVHIALAGHDAAGHLAKERSMIGVASARDTWLLAPAYTR